MNKENRRVICVDLAIYDKTAVLKTCYALQEKCLVNIKQDGEYRLQVTLLSKKQMNDDEQLEQEFYENLIDQQIRLENDRIFAPIREMIVEQAFKPVSYTKLKNKINK